MKTQKFSFFADQFALARSVCHAKKIGAIISRILFHPTTAKLPRSRVKSWNFFLSKKKNL